MSDFFSDGNLDIFAENYFSAVGTLSSVVAADTYSTFDTNKYKAGVVSFTGPYVIIEATSLTPANFAINNCLCVAIAAGKWLLYCSTGTDAVKRAQIYKTLFYGSNGTDARATTTYITGITALKTSVARDVGKRAYYATTTTGTGSDAGKDSTYTGTFASTSDNEDISSWSYLTSNNASGQVNATWQIPGGTVRNTITSSATSDEIGTDREADENDNSGDLILYTRVFNTSTITTGRVFILTAKSISFSLTGTAINKTASNIDFSTTHSVPIMTAADSIESEYDFIVTHTIPTGTFPATISSAIGVAKIAPASWEDGADIKFKLTNATEDTGWLNCSNSPEISTFTAFTSEPTKLIVKLISKSGGVALLAINGFWVYADVKED